MKFDRKIHFTERQLCDLSGPTLDALRVRAKTDPKFPEVLFVNNAYQPVYDKDAVLEWISSIEQPETLEIVPPRKARPLSQQGEYKPSPTLQINLQRAAELYQHTLITPKGIGNNANFGGRYDAWRRDGF